MEALEVEHLRDLRLRLAGCSHLMEGGIEIFQIWWRLGCSKLELVLMPFGTVVLKSGIMMNENNGDE